MPTVTANNCDYPKTGIKDTDPDNWEFGNSYPEIGNKLALCLIETYDLINRHPVRPKYITYSEVFTGMFSFAIITGVRNGWLDKKVYGFAALEARLGLISNIDKNGDIRGLCQGTNRKAELFKNE